MNKKLLKDYEIEDFLTDESFTNYHFQLNTRDELSWQEWLENNPEKKVIVKEARELIQALSLTISDEEYRAEFKKLRNAVKVKDTHPRFHLLKWNSHLLLQKTTRRALYFIPVIFIFVLAAYFLLQNFFTSPNQLTETVNNQNKALVITLSDSTIVTLTPHSILHYPSHFRQNERNVYLDGEAQFHVKRNEHAPFKVYSKNIIATVLGTIFNLKNSGDSSVVELLQGRLNVELSNNTLASKSIQLEPEEKAIYVKHNQAFYKMAMAPAAFKTDMSFHQNNFNEIASRIKYTFGITVINKSNKQAWRFTGNFKNTTAKEVIENICLVKGLSAEVKGDTIYIK